MLAEHCNDLACIARPECRALCRDIIKREQFIEIALRKLLIDLLPIEPAKHRLHAINNEDRSIESIKCHPCTIPRYRPTDLILEIVQHRTFIRAGKIWRQNDSNGRWHRSLRRY